MRTSVASAVTTDGTLSVSRAAQRTGIFSRKSAGTLPVSSPRKSPSWLVAMMMAMPMVKPLITASGMYSIRLPTRSQPAASRMRPAIRVAITRPS